jgi:hypothetical protein
MISEVRSQQGVVAIMSYFIEKEGKVYVFYGLTSPVRFDNYSPTFGRTMEQFKNLTDPQKLGVKPVRVKIRSAPRAGSLKSVLRSLGTSVDELEKMALLNGKILDDQIPAGAPIKIIAK